MFKFLKKKTRKVSDWELALLSNTIKHLPIEFGYLEAQIKSGLIKTSLLKQRGSGPDYITFTFDSNLINQFENKQNRNYQIKGIKLYDSLTNKKLEFTIYVYSGVISGYSIPRANDFHIDVSQIDTKSFKQVFIDNKDFKKLSKLLSKEETDLINPNDVYEVILNDKLFYHVQDLEDGNFIGIDTDKIIYKVSHDPFEISPIAKSLKDIYSNKSDQVIC